MGNTQDRGIGDHHRAFRGQSDTWLTPPEIIKSLGDFDLDPCCPHEMPWSTATRMIQEPADGLIAPWEGRVWVNPPYGPATGHWLQRLAKHGNGIALTFARTETQMFFEEVWAKAAALLFLRGRLHFYDGGGRRSPNNSGGPSVLVAYDAPGIHTNAETLLKCGLSGAFVPLRCPDLTYGMQ